MICMAILLYLSGACSCMAFFHMICAGSWLLMFNCWSSSDIPGLNSSFPQYQNRSAKNNDSDPHLPRAVSTYWNLRLAESEKTTGSLLSLKLRLLLFWTFWKHETSENLWRQKFHKVQGLGVCPCLSCSHVGRRLLAPQSDIVTWGPHLTTLCYCVPVVLTFFINLFKFKQSFYGFVEESRIVLTCVAHCKSIA